MQCCLFTQKLRDDEEGDEDEEGIEIEEEEE